jgi:hypothetical protein
VRSCPSLASTAGTAASSGIGGVAGCVTAVWGQGEWSAGTVQAHWGLARVAVSKRIGGRGFW